MSKKQKTALLILVILVFLLLIAVGGYIFILNRYPLRYQESIVEYAGKYELDPYFVCSIIWTESKFAPDVKSDRGAVGLMQIMPQTGEWIAGKLKEDFSLEDLEDPAINIRYGCWYLHFLSERLGGDRDLVAAAYNAGHNRVESWLEDPKYSADGTSLDKIPFEETKTYVERTRASYKIYQLCYRLEK